MVARADMLAALARAFSYPWDGIAATLSPAVEGRLGELAAQFPDRTAEQLAYTRLFIGSFKMEAPPYASYYLEEDHTLNGQAAVEVAAVYAQFGLELDSKEFAPADHLRYLLSFLALLAQRYEETGEEAFAEAYADFRDEYVLSWIDQFQTLVDKYAEDAYYPALVALIVETCKESCKGD